MADYVKTFGVVIKQNDVGEADRALTILTEDYGKVHIWVGGARRPRSKFVACSQLFCASHFMLYQTRETFRMQSAEVEESFFALRTDLDKLNRAAYLMRLTNDGVPEGVAEGCKEILRLLLNSLHFIANTLKNPQLVVHIFEIRFLSNLGFQPRVTEEGVEVEQGMVALSESARKAISHIVSAPMEQIFRFDVSPEVLRELDAFCKGYVQRCMGKVY